MYINSLHIDKYKIFEDLKIDFQIPKDNKNIVNIIAGVNGSGKTTLLDYILKKLGDDDYLIKGTITIDDDIHSSPRVIYIPSNMTFNYQAENVIDTNYKFINTIDTDKLLGNAELFIKNYIISKERQSIKSNPKDRTKDAIDSFNSIFKNSNLITKLIDLDPFDNNRPIFETLTKEKITIDKLSSGEQQLYARVVSLMILNPQNSIILIDEPEIALHPKWQIEIMKIYANIGENNQFIVTTHSPYIIGSVPNKNINFLIKEDNKIISINNILAYGRDINWILKEMGLENTREPKIFEKIVTCKDFLEEDNYDDAEKCIDDIESIIGNNDREVMALRNSLEFWRE